MGSLFSTPDHLRQVPKELKPSGSDFAALLKRRAAIPNLRTREEMNAHLACLLANRAIRHYNSTHPSAKFQCLDGPDAHTKAACVGFKRDLWYHLGFSASLKDDGSKPQRFFAELRFDPCADNTMVQTCTILEPPLGRFRSSCTFCPGESKILHPSDDTQFGCGKEGQENEFFRERRAWNGCEKEVFSQSDMLAIPFSLGGGNPRYRLVDQP
uniref:Uncharacterized protein n=3 Tax=Avena sativa TaxID=4498 RepID=A0ACD5WKI1_AVESA